MPIEKIKDHLLGRIQAAHEAAKWGHGRAVRALRRAFGREPFWAARAEYASALLGLGRVATPHEVRAAAEAEEVTT